MYGSLQCFDLQLEDLLLCNQTKVQDMGLSEEAMNFLEEHIPDIAEAAFKQAFWAALASGSSVLIREKEDLVEVFPDGTRKFIKRLPPMTPVTRGQRIEF